MKLVLSGCLAGLLVVPFLGAQTAAPGAQSVPSIQHFVCNTGYTLQTCREHTAVLRQALARFPLGELGEWTWILVRSEDWDAILLPRGLNTNSPAFTYYVKRETFIEGALVGQMSFRRGELLKEWGMTMSNLLNFAIAHELGHAFCNERDEAQADRIARLLLEQKPFACKTTLSNQSSSLKRPKDRYREVPVITHYRKSSY